MSRSLFCLFKVSVCKSTKAECNKFTCSSSRKFTIRGTVDHIHYTYCHCIECTSLFPVLKMKQLFLSGNRWPVLEAICVCSDRGDDLSYYWWRKNVSTVVVSSIILAVRVPFTVACCFVSVSHHLQKNK